MQSCADPPISEGEADSVRSSIGGRGSRLDVERCAPALASFREVHARMLADQRARAEGHLAEDRLVLFSPEPVITLGSGAGTKDLLLPREEYISRGVELREVDRGGEATFHGPGQRVGYLTLRLDESERDLHALLRSVEEALIRVLAELGVAGSRVEGRTGVWTGERKIASIGLSVRRWVTGHGFALCVDGALEEFAWIVPCGLEGCRYTTIAHETGRPVDRGDLDRRLVRHLGDCLDRRPPHALPGGDGS